MYEKPHNLVVSVYTCSESIFRYTECGCGSKESQSEFGKEADNSDLENQESKDTSSDETIDNADIEGEDSSEVESEDIQTTNLTNLLLPYLKICLILQQVPNARIYYHDSLRPWYR